MGRLRLYILLLVTTFQFQCKKIISCSADICSNKRTTKQTVTNQEGVMGTFMNNNESRWMINVFDDASFGLKMTCIICGDFSDSLKVMNKKVIFSGELKDACGVVDSNEESKFFIITPSSIR